MDSLISAGWMSKLIYQIPNGDGRRTKALCGARLVGDELLSVWTGRTQYVVHGTEEGKHYHQIREVCLAQGKPLYQARVENDQRWFVVHGTEEGRRYNEVQYLQFAEGKPLYRAAEGGDQLYLVLNSEADVKQFIDKITAAGLRYYSYDSDVDKPVYRTFTVSDRKHFIVHSAQEGKRYDRIHDLSHANGNHLFSVVQDKDHFIIHGTEEGTHHHGEIRNLRLVDGKPLYIVDEKDHEYVVHGSKTYQDDVAGDLAEDGESTRVIKGHTFSNGQFCSDCCCVVHGGKKSELHHGRIESLRLADGKPLYTKVDGRLKSVVHGTEEGKQYDTIGNVHVFQGKPLYVANNYGNGQFFVVHGNAELESYDAITSLTVNASMARYIGRKGLQFYLVYKSINPWSRLPVRLAADNVLTA